MTTGEILGIRIWNWSNGCKAIIWHVLSDYTIHSPPPPSRSLKLRPFHNICHIFPYRACLTELRKRAASAEKRRRGIPPVFWTLPTTELTMVQFWGRTSLPSGLCMCITHRTTTACLLLNYSAVQKISWWKSTKPFF